VVAVGRWISMNKGGLYASVGRFWLVNTYPYGCHPSVLSHHALGTVECDESNDGGTMFGRRGAGNYFTMSNTATRASS
jgi:hypothetical protein